MAARIEHLGVAVRSLDEARRLWVDVFGLPVTFEEEVASEGVRALGVDAGGAIVELLEPLDSEGPIARHIERRGEGIHHVAFEVEDIEAALERLRRAGVRLIDDAPRPGSRGTRVAFVHPKGAHGVLVELVEKREGRSG